MTQEQINAICNFKEKVAIYVSKMEAVYFFEERLGKTDEHVIDFRLSLSDDIENFKLSQIACEDCGVTEKYLKNELGRRSKEETV